MKKFRETEGTYAAFRKHFFCVKNNSSTSWTSFFIFRIALNCRNIDGNSWSISVKKRMILNSSLSELNA